ncbi:hypothetical protein H5410_009764 [Solanum commersonii]|uniref:Uncharacterized protein n=1 Tax=Solanum commersonii TaxID=4109 RepID=A0A9J6AKG8_SOLCO|nr:hypothetical protein H5410_009764 [Solanum commersonii]
MEIPLVYMFPNSITRVLAGSWNSNPGDSKMNIATATTTGPQSATIFISSIVCGVCKIVAADIMEMTISDYITVNTSAANQSKLRNVLEWRKPTKETAVPSRRRVEKVVNCLLRGGQSCHCCSLSADNTNTLFV